MLHGHGFANAHAAAAKQFVSIPMSAHTQQSFHYMIPLSMPSALPCAEALVHVFWACSELGSMVAIAASDPWSNGEVCSR